MTIPQIIIRAKISEYLAATAIIKSGLSGGGVPSYLPKLIMVIRKDVEDVYDLDPTNYYLVSNANYLYQLCGRLGLQASYLINSGGSIPSPTSTTTYGIPITSQYTATSDGETSFTLRDIYGTALPSNSRVTWVQKALLPLTLLDYTYVAPTLTLLNGIEMSADEVLTFQYVVPV